MHLSKKYLAVFVSGLLLPLSTSIADEDDQDHDNGVCMGSAPAILSVADFDGNGIVNDHDITIIKHARKKEIYYAFYDINADGEFDKQDILDAKTDLGKSSTSLDRQKAVLFHQMKGFQIIDNEPELLATQYVKIAPSLAGHGEHWTYQLPSNSNNIYRPEGLNFTAEDNRAMGLYWAQDAIPQFENGATDYPQPGGDWMTSRVVSFAGHPPKYTESPDEKWHTHAGLCIVAAQGDNEIVPELHQHTTFAECQAYPSLFKTAGDYNIWSNIWMLHGWIFDLNPNGFFAGTHPCADPGSNPEPSINDGRVVPPFFLNHHG